jgi:hypothetical protein
MNLLSPSKAKAFILALMLASSQDVKADRERPRSLSEMDQASSLIIDGTVTSVTDLGTEELPHPDGKPVLRTRRQAAFRIEKIQKGQVEGNADFVYLEYWKVTDSRYQGEVAPDLKVNDRFRLYADAAATDPSGRISIFVHTHNAVRPEVLEAPALTPDLSPEKGIAYTSPQTPSPVLPVPAKQASEAKPVTTRSSEEPASSTSWSVIVVLIVAALGLRWLLLKRRSNDTSNGRQ